MRVLSFAALYFVAAELGHLLSLKGPTFQFATFWPPSGFAVAVLVHASWRYWIPLLLAGGAANFASNSLLHGQPMLAGLGFCAANALEAACGAWLVRRYLGGPPEMTRIRDVLGLVFWSGLVSTLLGASVGAGVAALTLGQAGATSPEAPAWTTLYGAAWLAWWSADATGILVVAPVVCAWLAAFVRGRVLEQRSLPALGEGVAMFTGLVLVSEAVFGEWLSPAFTAPAYVLPFLLWAGLRFGPRAAATATFLTCVIAVWHACRGQGPYTNRPMDPAAQLVRMQGVLGVISLCSLLLAAEVSERRRAAKVRQALIEELQQALDEIKTLRGLIPICAWCSKVRDDGGFWQSVERYFSTHIDAKFTHGICPDCLAKQQTKR